LAAEGFTFADCIVELDKSYRFDPNSGIGLLSRAVGRGASDEAIEVLGRSELTDIAWLARPDAELRALICSGFEAVVQQRDPARALEALSAFRVLCAVRKGRWGVEKVNARIERWLAAKGWVSPSEAFYAGRPVMILRNDETLRLYNGDIGVVLPDPHDPLRPRVFFPPLGRGEVRGFAPAMLPPFETVFATTIHKSQGSEYDHVVVVLPDVDAPVLSRELLYTAITRARKAMTLIGPKPVLRAAIAREVRRDSGLGDRLWAAVG
jgi:exodeoxyribonuclease V alpha subunit